jgi:hypothetical protein
MANKSRLLLWSNIGFAGFTINNIILFITIDLSVICTIPGALGMVIMIYGLITEEF